MKDLVDVRIGVRVLVRDLKKRLHGGLLMAFPRLIDDKMVGGSEEIRFCLLVFHLMTAFPYPGEAVLYNVFGLHAVVQGGQDETEQSVSVLIDAMVVLRTCHKVCFYLKYQAEANIEGMHAGAFAFDEQRKEVIAGEEAHVVSTGTQGGI